MEGCGGVSSTAQPCHSGDFLDMILLQLSRNPDILGRRCDDTADYRVLIKMDAAVTEYLEPPDESHELLELLHSIIRDLAGHFQRRFQNQSDPYLVHRRLMVQLDELNLFLGEYIKQGVSVDKELYTAAYRVAGSLRSMLHGRRIQEVLRTERLEVKIAKEEVRSVHVE